MTVCQDFLVGEAGPAPDGLVRFRLYPSCQLGEPLHLVERIAAAERNIADIVILDDLHEVVDAHLVPVLEFP